MLDTFRRYVEAGMGKLSSKRAEDIAKALVKKGEARKEQAAKIATDLVEWSKRNGERLVELVRREVKKQVTSLGVATKEDIDALRRRIKALEGAKSPARASASTRKSPAKKAGARKPPA